MRFTRANPTLQHSRALKHFGRLSPCWQQLAAQAAEWPDSKNGKIAFFANLNGVNQLYTINPDGTGFFQVTDLPPAIDDPHGFSLQSDFSPDGERIVFPHDMTGALELYVINADGTGLTQITHDGTLHAVPHWSPDGAHIVFATPSSKTGRALVIATVAADGSDKRELTSPTGTVSEQRTPRMAGTSSSAANWMAWWQPSGSWTPTANTCDD